MIKHISLYALGRLKWILDVIWHLNQHFNLKNQRNWIKQVLMLRFLMSITSLWEVPHFIYFHKKRHFAAPLKENKTKNSRNRICKKKLVLTYPVLCNCAVVWSENVVKFLEFFYILLPVKCNEFSWMAGLWYIKYITIIEEQHFCPSSWMMVEYVGL